MLMSFSKKILTSALVAFLSSAGVAAAQDDDSSEQPEALEADTSPDSRSSNQSKTRKIYSKSRDKGRWEELGLSLIFAADLGLLTAFPATTLKSYGPKYGLALEGKALGSFLLDKYMFDAGLGWWFYGVTGAEPVTLDLGAGETTFSDDVELKLSGSMLELAPSYRFTNDYFAGPIIQFRYPSDRGYDAKTERKDVGLVIGAQAGYQIFDLDLNTRFVGRMLLPVNDKDWLGLYLMAGVQVGLPFVQPEVLTVQEITTKTQEKRVVKYKKQEFKFKLSRELVKVILDGLVIFYPDPGYPTLTTESQAFFIDFAKSLSESESDWGVLKIDTINKDYAAVIRVALVSAGINDKKVRIGQTLPGKPSTTPPVEFSFFQVKDPAQVQRSVRNAMQAMQIPETCEDGECK